MLLRRRWNDSRNSSLETTSWPKWQTHCYSGIPCKIPPQCEALQTYTQSSSMGCWSTWIKTLCITHVNKTCNQNCEQNKRRDITTNLTFSFFDTPWYFHLHKRNSLSRPRLRLQQTKIDFTLSSSNSTNCYRTFEWPQRSQFTTIKKLTI